MVTLTPMVLDLSSSMSIVVCFTPRPADLIYAGLTGLRARPIIATIGALFFIALPWAAAVVGMVARELGKPVPWATIIMLAVIPVLAVPFFVLLPILLFGRSPALAGEHKYEFADEEMRFTGPSFENKLKWSVVTACVSSRFGIMLFSGKVPLVSIPRRALNPGLNAELGALFARKGVPYS